MHHFVNRTAATPLFREDVGTPPVGLGGRRSAAFGSPSGDALPRSGDSFVPVID